MSKENNESRVALIKAEINRELGDVETMNSLISTTFMGKDKIPMPAALVKRALLEGMIRGFTFQNFLERDVYAIPFGDTYSLVTSIDYSRKIGAKSGVVGVAAPVYTEKDGKIIACSVTVKKKIAGYVGNFTAEVYFNEYSTNKNLWTSKPRTMIAKVAEQHALRKACPEELAQSYVEEELAKAEVLRVSEPEALDPKLLEQWEKMLKGCKEQGELERVWADMPGALKVSLKDVLEEMKAIIADSQKDIV